MSIDGAGDIRRTILGFDERASLGKLLRQQVPRRLHGQWKPAADRPDPLDVVRARNRGRQQRLVPIRLGRMVASPFAFYRGSADLMAIDLRPTPATGLVVQLCGDAHLSNFGVYASPERHLALDINDFDETGRGRWEWDVKRLLASVELCGRDNGAPDRGPGGGGGHRLPGLPHADGADVVAPPPRCALPRLRGGHHTAEALVPRVARAHRTDAGPGPRTHERPAR